MHKLPTGYESYAMHQKYQSTGNETGIAPGPIIGQDGMSRRVCQAAIRRVATIAGGCRRGYNLTVRAEESGPSPPSAIPDLEASKVGPR
jgi:hypothetical protein